MLAVIESNPYLLKFVSMTLAVVIVGFFLKMLKQTHVIVYIITGVVVGPHVLGVFTDAELITSLGSLGLILLLFFIGMEISLQKLVANWKISVIGTILQVIFSVLAVWLIGQYYDWSMARILTLGFVVSLSSTAVIVKLLQDSGEIDHPVGQNVLGVLLVQDVLIVPMLICMSYLSGTETSVSEIALQLVGGVLLIGFVLFLFYKKEIRLPFHKTLKSDHELQVFFAFGLCFGFSTISGFFGLSTALGAFIAGIFVATSKSTNWFHKSLYSFKVLFVALFFISIGMLIDIHFLWEHLVVIGALVIVVFISNNLINALIMRGFKMSWKDSLYAGALLSQIGEFSFVLGQLAYSNEIITNFGYQTIVAVISLTLLLSPFWIGLTKRFTSTAEVSSTATRHASKE
ncbi:cation:proton antiporter [Reichenbachiella carrageenanivorans]|uniref:Cation:proton antiporter n=1 Tax=Reichenbachiella carrageenanivorans TaxID=2979869 RepID=A0ABY6D6S2_9BACT|nr:cation:proton antiporter [Reichenbachiella carrageenanivorans]UXX81315.1 cation:proton antiporter [Reichenbachiella carrageenanivorans]